ncbi:MAG: hypothetical protein K8R23_09435 [Chthoniobacter sp.]|nr:hypothetical protein [Chthoniobacter sp.]
MSDDSQPSTDSPDLPEPEYPRFTNEVGEVLCKAPLAVFLAVAGADGELPSKYDIERFKMILSSAFIESEVIQDSMTYALLRHLRANLSRMTQEVLALPDAGPLFAEAKSLAPAHFPEMEHVLYLTQLGMIGSYATMDADGAYPPVRLATHDQIARFMEFPTLRDAVLEGGVDETQWTALSRGIVAAFLAVAVADGDIGEKEYAAFHDWATAQLRPSAEGSIAREVLARCLRDLRPLATQVMHSPKPLLEKPYEAAVLSRHLFSTEDSQSYRAMLMDVARTVAKAEGGGLLGMGGKISKEERTVLERLSEITGNGV